MQEILGKFKEALLSYDHAKSEDFARAALEQGVDPVLVAGTLTDALGEVGEAFAREDIYLPELVLASRAGKAAMAVIEDELRETSSSIDSKGTIVLGTVQGDVHDIGKNIVATLFFANGFEVIDLGVDVPAADFVTAVREHSPDLLGLSALLTTTMTEQRVVIEQLEEAGLREDLKIVVGGAPVSEEFAEEIGADGYGPNALDAVELGKRMMESTVRELV